MHSEVVVWLESARGGVLWFVGFHGAMTTMKYVFFRITNS